MNTTVAAHAPWSKRPRFAPRQLLDAERLNAALDDELDRQRLLNLALHGWGVVFGFAVTLGDTDPDRRRSKHDCVRVTRGLALDPFGRMLHTDDRWLSLDDLEGKPPTLPGRYTLFVHHAERLDPPAHDSCGGSGPQWREYGVVFTLRSGCKPVDDGCPELADPCLSRTDYVRRRIGSTGGPPGRSQDLEHAGDRPGALRPTRWGSWCYDPAAGVPIACLELSDLHLGKQQGKQQNAGGEPEEPCLVIDRICTQECSPVRHVYRSPLLRELLDCCDVALPRVDHVSWQSWDELDGPVPWDEFESRVVVVDEADADEGLAIWFDRPIRVRTLTTASLLVAAVTQESLADYWTGGRVPLAIRPLQVADGLAQGAQLVADGDWRNAEVLGRRSSLFGGFRLEFTIRGQLLRDECGHMLDAVPPEIGCRPCQARPGDDLIWAFEVGERGAPGSAGGGRQPYESTGEVS